MTWDFSIARSIAILARTWPFLLARIVVYGLVAFAYVTVTGMGATVGWGLGAFGDEGFRAGATFWGGAAGFLVVSGFLYLAREWFLYVLKAGHIAVMVAVFDGRPVPGGFAQIAEAGTVVKARFLEANVLFVMDRLVRGTIRAVGGLIDLVGAILPIPGLGGLARLVRALARVAVGLVDEMILAYNIRIGSTNPFATARDALVLYAQNAVWILKNAIWLVVMVWILAFLIFLVLLAPAAGLVYFLPGTASNFGFVFAIVFAVCLKAAVLEPFAVASMMQVYFRAIEGQRPRADWSSHLDEASARFRELGERARAFAGRSGPGESPAGPAGEAPPTGR